MDFGIRRSTLTTTFTKLFKLGTGRKYASLVFSLIITILLFQTFFFITITPAVAYDPEGSDFDLGMKVLPPSEIYPGSSFDFQIKYINNGPQMAQSYRQVVEISPGLSFVEKWANVRDYQGNIAVTNSGNLVPGVESVPGYSITVNEDASGTEFIKVRIDNVIPNDPNPNNNELDFTIKILSPTPTPTPEIDLQWRENSFRIVTGDLDDDTTVTPTVGKQFRAALILTNIGNQASGIINERLFLIHPDGSEILQSINSLPPLTTKSII